MNSPETNTAILDKEPQPRDVEAEVMRDFYLSFKFSQGTVGLQRVLFTALGQYYNLNLDSDQKAELINFAEGSFVQKAQTLKAPKAHKMNSTKSEDALKEDVAETFRVEAAGLANRLTNQYDPGYVDQEEGSLESISPELLKQIAICTISQDETFMRKGRRIQAHTSTSFFREYIIMRKPTHSDAFDDIFSSTHDLFMSEGLPDFRDSLNSLAKNWEAAHPGESFYPEAA